MRHSSAFAGVVSLALCGAAFAQAPAPVDPPPEAPAAPPEAAPAAATDVKKVVRIAVYGFESTGADERLVAVMTSSIVAELRKLQRVSVVTLEEVKVLLDIEAQKQVLGCSQESCLAEIAEALGVDAVVTGTLAQVGDPAEGGQLSFGVKRLDQVNASVVGTFTRTIEARDRGAAAEGVLALVGPAIEALFPEAPLRPGMKRGVEPELARRVNPPPLAPWVFWTSAAVTGGAVVGATAAGIVNVAAWSSTQGFVDEKVANAEVIEGTDLNTRVGVMRTALGTAAAAGAIAVLGAATAGVLALFTDWDADEDLP